MKFQGAEVSFAGDRVAAFLETLDRMASGQVDARLPLSPVGDALDAIASGINAAVATAEARQEAILKTIPDLMFVLRRDGTYVDYHARDPKLLFVAPAAFIGRPMREVLPPGLAGKMTEAFERACGSLDPVVVEYELQLDEPRFFEARIVQMDADRVLTTVRDVTELKRASALNRDLARRLISRQEIERQRIARELHDDISQRLALLNIEIGQLAGQTDSEQPRARLRKLSADVGEIAVDVHRMSYELHPSRLRTLGLVPALESLCQDTSKQRHLHLAFTHDAIPSSIDAAASLCLYRILQEALHNVVRHSHANEAQVSLTCDERHLMLQVTDSGVGFDPAHVVHSGLGLVSMRERVAILNGQLTIEAVPDGGTRVTARIPLGSAAATSAPAFVASV